MTDGDRIRHLEDENARLRRIAEAAGIPPIVRPDLPDHNQLATLRSMVLSKYAVQLSCTPQQFELALHWTCFARRQPKPNTQFYPVHWLDVCREWLHKQGFGTDMSLRALVAGCVASGVTYTPLDRWPFDVELGLARGDVSKPSNAWRRVLAHGLPEPTPLNRPVPYVFEQQTMIVGADEQGNERSSDVRVERS